MGSCFSEPSYTNNNKLNKNIYNPIQGIVDQYSIDKLNEKWDRNQLKIIEGKVSTIVQNSITLGRFLQIFPKLLKFSPQTQKKYYKLFAFEGNSQISKSQLIQSLTIIKKVSDNRHLAPLIFYVYTKEPKHTLMSEAQLQLFEQENKMYAKNLQDIDDQKTVILEKQNINGSSPIKLSHEKSQSEINKRTDESNSGKKIRNITLSKFIDIFEHYNLQSYQILFSWNIAEEQKQLVDYIEREGIIRTKGDKVYLVEYQWFLAWKQYAEKEYNAKIEYNDQDNEVNYMSYKSANRRKSKEQSSRITIQLSKVERPGEIKNYVLKYGKKDNELHQNLVQFNNYICVRQFLWNKLVAIYNGGPAIERIYPKIYYNIVVKVGVNENGKFISRSSKKIQSRERPTVSGYATSEQLNFLCYFKYPGKNNWKHLNNVSAKSEDIFNGPRTYLTFVPKYAKQDFISRYNIEERKEAKLLKERFANYGNEINFSIEGVLNRAEVVEIQDEEHVTIEFINQGGNNERRTIENDDNFQKFNPQNISNENLINVLSGLDNIGNTCYMNAVIQCLIKTPFFGSYLERQKFQDKKQDDQLLIEQISKIYMKSKNNNHESINTKSLKRTFEKHCPYFEGNSQHDAQEFLICLLQRLMEEIKIKREQYGVKSELKKSQISEEDKNMNKKVVKFFSGKTQAITLCKKCNNKGVRIQSFFTYSISLPEQPVVQFFYQYVPYYKTQQNKSTVPILCGATLKRKITVEQFIEEVSTIKKLQTRKIALYTVFNNQILNKLQHGSYHKQISYYLHFNAKLVCYQVQHEDSPTFYDYQRRNLSNKSIKIQLRQRIYSQKNHQYKVIYQPYIIEVTDKMYWKDIVNDIKIILQKLQKSIKEEPRESNNQNPLVLDKTLGVSDIKVSTNTVKHTNSLESTPQTKFFQSSLQSRYTMQSGGTQQSSSNLKQQYKIRVVKSDHLYQNNCVFCKDEFVANKRFFKRLCKGCSFNQTTTLFQQSEFRNICDNIIITLDWQASIPEFEKFIKDPSYDICIHNSQNRRDMLQELLINNFNSSQSLELTCEKENCLNKFAVRSEKISIYPNILLLHLKRFTYEDNMLVKLTNSVIYPQTLELGTGKKEKYQLYGVVSHIGSGVGGHYISFVKVLNKWYKCDDNRVIYAQPNQQIDSNAYLLFYKKIDFEPSLITLSF